MKKSIVAFLATVSFSANTSVIEQDGCSTKTKTSHETRVSGSKN